MRNDDITRRLETFNGYRALLFSIAYRMLGSLADAEDMVQETFLRWQESSAEEVRAPRAFLVTVLSRLCINQLQSARVRRETYVGQWLPEPLLSDPDADPHGLLERDESISMAFLVLMERLTPMERAVFLLREVFQYDYPEIAATLHQSEANCRQILRRARQHVGADRPRFSATRQARNELFERFVRASTGGDLQELVALLATDAVLYSDGGGKAVALPGTVRGADAVANAITDSMRNLVPRDLDFRRAQINGGPGLVTYRDGTPFSVLSLEIDHAGIHAIYIVTNPEKLAHLARRSME